MLEEVNEKRFVVSVSRLIEQINGILLKSGALKKKKRKRKKERIMMVGVMARVGNCILLSYLDLFSPKRQAKYQKPLA